MKTYYRSDLKQWVSMKLGSKYKCFMPISVVLKMSSATTCHGCLWPDALISRRSNNQYFICLKPWIGCNNSLSLMLNDTQLHMRSGWPEAGIKSRKKRIHQTASVGIAWWRHQMETFSALLVLCAGNSPVPGEFPAERPVTRSFDIFFDLRLNKSWVNNCEADDLRRYRAHYDVNAMV